MKHMNIVWCCVAVKTPRTVIICYFNRTLLVFSMSLNFNKICRWYLYLFNLSGVKAGQITFYAQTNGSAIPSNIRISISNSKAVMASLISWIVILFSSCSTSERAQEAVIAASSRVFACPVCSYLCILFILMTKSMLKYL